MSMDDLVYVEIYCTDLKLYGAFNKAYASTLKSPYPARDFIGVKDLLFGAHFEVMGIAVLNASQNKRQPLAVKYPWRNARTVASHTPAIYRERTIRDYFLNQ